MPAANGSSPWYKHIWPWIIIAILACSVTLTLSMVTIAVNNPDHLVNDNYYEAGKGINRSLDRELLGQTLQLKAKLRLDEMTGEVVLLLEGNSQPGALELNLISPTQPEKDRRINLKQSTSEPGRYTGQLDDKVEDYVAWLSKKTGKPYRMVSEATREYAARASIIPLVAVPVSLIGTFAVMHMFGFSLNALLLGLVLATAVGLVLWSFLQLWWVAVPAALVSFCLQSSVAPMCG